MSIHRGRKKGKHEKKYTMICDWCTERKETSREDAKTCSGRCRQRMAFFIRACGYPPDHPPGPVTAQDAIDLEILRLFRQEKERRRAARAALLAGDYATHSKLMGQ